MITAARAVFAARLALFWLAACGGGDDAPYTVTGERGQAVAIHLDGWVPQVAASIGDDDVAPASVLVDTGAPMTLLARRAFPALADLPDGQHAVDLHAFGVTFGGLDAAVFELFGGGEGLPGGIIGGDILTREVLWLDYRAARARLYASWDAAAPPHLADGAGAPTLIDLDVAGGGTFLLPGSCGDQPCGLVTLGPTRLLVQARFEDLEPMLVLVDTGASSVVMNDTLLDALGDPANRPRLDGVSVGTVNGTVTAAYSRVARLSLFDAAGHEVSLGDQPVLVVHDSQILALISQELGRPIVALLGGSFLRHYQTTIDAPSGLMALARYQVDDHVPADEFIGPGFTLARQGDAWLVADVYPGTSAASQGLLRGDQLLSIDGTSIPGLDAATVDALLRDHPVGDSIHLELETGGTPYAADVRIEDLLPSYTP
jgi:hypothetical protein